MLDFIYETIGEMVAHLIENPSALYYCVLGFLSAFVFFVLYYAGVLY